MRILFTTNALVGHVYPMLPLMRAARHAGHQVMVATGPEMVGELKRRGYGVWPVGPSFADGWAVRERALSDSGLTDPMQKMLLGAAHLFARPAAERARQLVPLAARWQPDIVLHEATELAGWEAAAASGAMDVTVGLGTMDWALSPFAETLFSDLAQELGTPNRQAAFHAAPFLDLCPPSLATEGLPFADVWPIRPEVGDFSPHDRLPLEVLNLPRRPTIYLTLGTVVNAPEHVRTTLDAIQDLPINVVVTAGAGVDPATFGLRPSNVVVLSFVPQALILPHVSAVISHAGSGTMLGALTRGLPQVALPMGADQFSNAEHLSAAGAAVSLRPDEVTPAALRDAVTSVLTNPSYSAAAGRLRLEIESMPSAAEVLDDLSVVVDAPRSA